MRLKIYKLILAHHLIAMKTAVKNTKTNAVIIPPKTVE